MKPVISPEYAALNKQLHGDRPDYGTGGGERAPMVVQLARGNGWKTILDFGCGKGGLKPAIAELAPELTVWEFDPAVPGKDELPTESPDIVAAIDVMEHIEPDYLEGVLQTLQGLQPRAVLLLVSTRAANKLLADGRNAHLIVQPKEWWVDQLARYFHQTHLIDMAPNFIYLGIPLPLAAQ